MRWDLSDSDDDLQRWEESSEYTTGWVLGVEVGDFSSGTWDLSAAWHKDRTKASTSCVAFIRCSFVAAKLPYKPLIFVRILFMYSRRVRMSRMKSVEFARPKR